MEPALKIIQNPKRDIIQINHADLLKKGYLVTNNDKSPFTEQYRQIKRTVIDKAFGTKSAPKKSDNSNLVMVTSPNEGEGKTFVSVNLALSSVLEKDKMVLLIDANVINPELNNTFGMHNCDGLVDFLLGDVECVGDIIYNTSISNLKIIPAGRPHHLTNEMLASDQMKNLTNELATRYSDRLVILDAPQVNGVTETSVVAGQVGQVLLVVQDKLTTITSAKQAKNKLPSENDVGIIINKRVE